jgi:hypothetical protein
MICDSGDVKLLVRCSKVHVGYGVGWFLLDLFDFYFFHENKNIDGSIKMLEVGTMFLF